jgi:hypothetical protein
MTQQVPWPPSNLDKPGLEELAVDQRHSYSGQQEPGVGDRRHPVPTAGQTELEAPGALQELSVSGRELQAQMDRRQGRAARWKHSAGGSNRCARICARDDPRSVTTPATLTGQHRQPERSRRRLPKPRADAAPSIAPAPGV